MLAAGRPSASIAVASPMKVPMTRLVKNPRLSLTTIGVFLICSATSIALAMASSEVCSPTTISSSGILSTGEKKCMPMKSAGRVTPLASPVTGNVEVFDASSDPSAMYGSISAYTLCFRAGSSNTASIRRSAPLASAGLSVAVIRSRTSSADSCVILPRATALSRIFLL